MYLHLFIYIRLNIYLEKSLKKVVANIILFFVVFYFNVNAQTWLSNVEDANNFYSIQKSFYEEWNNREYQKGQGWKQFKRWEYFWKYRIDEQGNFPSAMKAYKSYLNFLNKKNNDELLAEQKSWEEIGPTVIPTNKLSYSSSGVGRINVVRINPSNDNEIWVGSAAGGVWKSSNKGNSWRKMGWTDIMSLGVSDIAISPSNPKIIYIATGDKNGHFQESTYSIGLMKSEDGGETWSVVGMKSNLSESFLMTKILIDPSNSDVVLISTSRGIFKSIDGGKTWENKQEGLFREMEYKPNNFNVIYATTSGFYSYNGNASFYKSTDAGESWKKIIQNTNVNRFEIAVTPANSSYVYIIGALKNNGSYAGVWRSDNSGDNFELMSNSPNILSIAADGNGTYGQGFYDLAIAVNPVNENELYIGGIHIWKSSNGGRAWELISHWTGSYKKPYVHADQHYLLFNPKNLDLYSANDGGLYVSSDNGISWKDLSNGLGIAQFYRISVANTPEVMLTGGTQDNGTHLFNEGDWFNVNGGDGMETHINPKNPKLVFCTTQNGSLFRSTNGGMNFKRVLGPDYFDNESGEWVTPFVLNPSNPTTVLVGYRDVYKSVNNGTSWLEISNFNFSNPIDLISYAPSDTNYIYIVQGATIYRTKNGGLAWETIGQARAEIRDIAVDYDDPNRFWIAVSSFGEQEQIYEYYGQNKTNISYDLPSIPANTIVTVKNSSGKLVIGTDIGTYYKNAAESSWKIFGKDLPPVVVTDLEINYSTGKIYAGTFGRGIWANEIFACQISAPNIIVQGDLEFCYGDSVTLSLVGNYENFKWSNGDTNTTITVYSTGSYYVIVTDNEGCSARSEVIDVNVKQVPTFEISATNNGNLCGLDSISLTLPLGVKDYVWNTGATTRRIWVKKPGKYYATATANNGCHLFSNILEVQMGELPPKPKLEQIGNQLVTDSGYTYKWYLNGNTMIVADTNVIEINQAGDYQVEIINSFSCSSLSDVLKVVTSVEDKNLNSITVAPNPTYDFIDISANFLVGNSKIRVQNINGLTMIEDKLDFSNVFKHRISLANLPIGVYLLIIENQGNTYFEKIIKFN